MARIPEQEVERLKQEILVQRLGKRSRPILGRSDIIEGILRYSRYRIDSRASDRPCTMDI